MKFSTYMIQRIKWRMMEIDRACAKKALKGDGIQMSLDWPSKRTITPTLGTLPMFRTSTLFLSLILSLSVTGILLLVTLWMVKATLLSLKTTMFLA